MFILVLCILFPSISSYKLTQQPNGDVHLFKLGNAGNTDRFIVNGNQLVTGYSESTDSDEKRAIRILAMSLGYSYTALVNGVTACKNNDATTCLQLCKDGSNTVNCYCSTQATVCNSGQSCAINTGVCS